MNYYIDLRSDTVTKPTDKMRTAMKNAVVGDDVMKEDPTVQMLQDTVAKIFHKEAALFFPSGTMSNLTALLSWCSPRGSEVIVGDKSHIFLFEQAGASQFGGISFRTVPNQSNGTIHINDIELAIRDNDIHEPSTQLICIENTHNVCGGTVLPLSFMKELKDFSINKKIPIHLDGARIWNAIAVMNIEPYEISKQVDSLSVCLSKGLGSPVGSLLLGNREFIEKARRIRKALGGGMRQAGVLAAAGIESLKDFFDGVIKGDHNRTQIIATEMRKMQAFKISENIDTNIIFSEIVSYNKIWEKNSVSTKVADILKGKRVLVSAWSPFLMRLVIHRDINDEEVLVIINALKEVSDFLTNF
jgi:threonine aldolase